MEVPRVFVSRRSRRRTLLYTLALLVGGGLVLLATRTVAPQLGDPGALRATIRGFGVWAPVAFVVLQAAQVVVAPIPGQVFGFASGYLFGALLGTAYSVLGAAIGSAVVFVLTRRYGRTYTERVVVPETLARFDGVAGDRGLATLFVCFLVPGLPDDVLCFVGGLTDIDLRKLIAIAVVGRFPGFLLVNLAGAQVAAQRHVEAGVVLLALFALSGIGYLWRDAILGRLQWWGGDAVPPTG